MVRQIAKCLESGAQTGLPVHVAEDPLSAVAEGTGKVLEELAFLKKVSNHAS